MPKRSRSLIILLVVSIMVLSVASVAFGSDGIRVQEDIQLNEVRNLDEQEENQYNCQKQLRQQEGDGVCSEDCEPLQKREQNHELKEEERKLKQGGRNQEDGNNG